VEETNSDRRWTIWQPDDSEPVPLSPGPRCMRLYAGPTPKPGERLELVPAEFEAAYRELDRQMQLVLDNVPERDPHHEPSYRDLIADSWRVVESLRRSLSTTGEGK
jgi:hypothetical protein